jgi:O-antigen ligase
VRSAATYRGIEQAIFALVILGTLCIPLAVLPHAFDAYRLPKEVALRAEAILLLAVILGALVMGFVPLRLRVDRWLLLPSIAFVWMIVVTLTSTNRAVSAWRLAAGAATLIVFVVTLHVARERRSLLIGIPVAAAVANALVALMQELNLWMPFGSNPDVAHHLQCTAFIGNPNELGSYLAVAALACVAATAAGERRRRWFAIAAAALVVGLLATQTLTAIIAFAAGCAAMVMMLPRRRAVAIGASAAALAIILVALFTPLRQRAANMVQWTREGNYNALLTDRIGPFVAASMMTADHPLTGVGPGAFSWNYYTYKPRAERWSPMLRQAWNRGVNFGEVHNDHLQVLADSGIPGYILFLSFAGIVGAISVTPLTRSSSTLSPLAGRGVWGEGLEARRFALILALPLAVALLVLSTGQFPLESTAVRMLLAHLAALCAAWSAP